MEYINDDQGNAMPLSCYTLDSGERFICLGNIDLTPGQAIALGEKLISLGLGEQND